MNISALLKKAKKKGKTALDEKESKELLKEYGIPVISETVVSNQDEAIIAAQKIGFPVVLKGLGSTILHKTERGLVHLNLTNSDGIRQAVLAISAEAGDELDGYLIQPQVAGKRELVAGLFHDDQFGPVVMFGIGGIFAEALSDVTFRLAPLTETDAGEMLDEIKAKALFENFRGERAVDRLQLIQTLMGLSRIGVDHPDITEVDINPIIITFDGKVSAVDALVVIGNKTDEKDFLPPVDPRLLGRFFHPQSIAFVGASPTMGKWGHTLFMVTLDCGYKGKMYLVNPKGGTIAGRKVYKTVAEIPDQIDLAVVTIPASGVMDLIPQFKEKGIKNMLLTTSGFSETGEKGKEIEKQLAQSAQKEKILLVGSNTMGICNPHINFQCVSCHFKPRPGSISVVAQSGNMGTQLLAFAEQQDIGIRAYCGTGNEAMITIEDYLDAFEIDPLTRTLVLYIESVKNGRRFYESALRVGKKKPVVLLKGGQTEAGKRAAASHTGALSSDSKIFDAVCRQAGIIKVDQPMELVDLSAAFSSLPLPKGNRVAIVTLGGGWGVITSDLCVQYGLKVPELPPAMLKRFDTLLPSYWSRSNPIDLVGESENSMLLTIMEELMQWNGCDAVLNLGILGRSVITERLADTVLKNDSNYTSDFINSMKSDVKIFEKQYIDQTAILMEKYRKPILGVSLVTSKNKTVYSVKDIPYQAVFYLAPERAVKVCAKMYEYQRFLQKLQKNKTESKGI